MNGSRRILIAGGLIAAVAWADTPPKGPMVPVQGVASVMNFDNVPAGTLPKEFESVSDGSGATPRWGVMPDPQAPSRPNVLAQAGQAAAGTHYTFALLKMPPISDGSLTVTFKAVRGEEAQGAGLVYRYESPDNFYVVWADAKEDTCALIRVKKGKSKVIDSEQAIVTADAWHTMRAVFAQNTFALYLNDDLVMGLKDKGLLEPGRVGLATRGDAVTEFDDLIVVH